MDTLTTMQRAAATSILERLADQGQYQCVLAGYAGSGKTYTVQRIAKVLLESRYRVVGITHTAKALSVLAANMPAGVVTMTIYRALGWRIDGRTQNTLRGGHRLAGFDVIIVDESSMVDADMYRSLQRAAGDAGARILWVGDPAQLPPISESNELSPVFSQVEGQYRLTEVVRQSEGSPIIRASMYLRECLERSEAPCIDKLRDRADSEMVEITSGGTYGASMSSISAIESGLDSRVIAWTNRAVNASAGIIANHFHPHGSPRVIAGDPVMFATRLGDKIATDELGIVLEQQDEIVHGPLELECLPVKVRLDSGVIADVFTPVDIDRFLNDMGTLTRELAAAKRAEKAGEKTDRVLRVGTALQECREAYANLRHVYSLTAHKAQGSTFDVACVDWSDISGNMDRAMTCRLLYVACTRPSQFLSIAV